MERWLFAGGIPLYSCTPLCRPSSMPQQFPSEAARRADCAGGLGGVVDPQSAAGCCLVGPHHRAAACGIPGTPGLTRSPWQAECPADPGAAAQPLAGEGRLGVSSRLLAGRAGSWSLAVRLRDPRAGVSSLAEGLVPDVVEYWVWGIPKLVFTYKGSEPGFSWTPSWGIVGFWFFFLF